MICDHYREFDSKHGRARLIVVHIFFGLALTALLALFFGYFVMQLWNYVVPAVTHFRPITYGQSVALLVLARVLVGGIGHHGHGIGHFRERHYGKWRDYEEWWQRAGKQSFEEFTDRKGD